MGEEGSHPTPMIQTRDAAPWSSTALQGTLLMLPISFWLEKLGKGKWKIKC